MAHDARRPLELTNYTTSGDERLIAAVAVEDTSILFSIATATANEFKNIDASAFEYGKHGPERLRDILLSFFATRHRQLACISISMPGTIDTKNATMIDIPRREWNKARNRAQGKPLFDFREVLSTLGYSGPIIVDNDTTMAALGERDFQNLGSPSDVGSFAYIRAGLGINAAVVMNGRPWHGALNPEMGHIIVRRHERDECESTCSFHATCLEGLVAWPAIENRIKKLAGRDINLIWDMVAYYIGQLCVMLTMVFAPTHVVVGGLLLREKPSLLERIQNAFDELHGSYPRYAPLYAPDYIRCARGAAEQASLLGALKVAHEKIFSELPRTHSLIRSSI
jgi:predicted NBD/HSP70 family sugar kinase